MIIANFVYQVFDRPHRTPRRRRAAIFVAHSVVTGNNPGVKTSGGTLFSYGDNDVDGTANINTGVLTSLAMH
jgi:hypothetical protein